MTRVIKIKVPLGYFEKDRHNKLEARLAKFELNKGDVIRFVEWDDKKDKLTGHFYDRKVVNFHKIHKATKYWSKRDLTKYGLYIFELDEAKG